MIYWPTVGDPHQSFFAWLAGEAGTLLRKLLSGSSGAVPGGWWGLVALAAASDQVPDAVHRPQPA